MGSLEACTFQRTEDGVARNPTETIIGSVDEGIRTRGQLAQNQIPINLNPEPEPPESEPLKSFSTSETARHLNAAFPGRVPQVSQLLSALGEPGELSPPTLVWGGPATGKTSIVRGALRLLGWPSAYINCRSSGTPRMMVEAIINQLAGHVRSSANNYVSHRKCTDLNDFILSLPSVCAAAAERTSRKPKPVRNKPRASSKRSRESAMETFPSLAATKFVLVFDHAELLRTDETNTAAAYLLPALLDLPRLTGISTLSVVLISSVSWDAFESGTGCNRPATVDFPDYLVQLRQILCKERPPLYPSFAKKVLDPFARINRMLTELNQSMEPAFRKYLEPIEQGRIEPALASTEEGGRKLYSLVLPHLKATLLTLSYELSAAKCPQTSKVSGQADMSSFQMSGGCRFLLIAAYIASRNPASLDSAYLDDVEGGRGKKKRKSGGMSDQVKRDIEIQEEHLRGPLVFPLERLSAIFKCVARDVLHLPASPNKQNQDEQGIEDPGFLHKQLLTLLGVGLVSKAGGDPMEGGAKYRCNASKELVEKTARDVKFPLATYLLHG